MKNRLKYNIFSIIAVLSAVTLLFVGSCKKQDEMHRKYMENGEILYLGKTDSLFAYSGHQRAKVLWLPPKDPKVEQMKIVWNNGQDSLAIPIEQLTEGDFQEVIIDELTEGVQTFVVHSINSDGYSSIKSELNIPVYGENYLSTILNRFPVNVTYWNHTLNITLASAEESVVNTEFSYKDINGNTQTASVGNEMNNISIDDVDPDQPIRYRTEHAPDSNVIDQFWTAYDELEVSQSGIMPIFISGFMRDAIDDAKNDVNYEYIQLMAAVDIDFSETPFSIVACRNPSGWTPNPNEAPEQGWAVGERRSYKFDLTTGTVSKGEFFYVGGTSKLINGQNSTDISGANWIRVKNHGTEVGDGGMGSVTETTGLFPNYGTPAGIALFMGTTVTSASVPIDAVFFGSMTNGIARLFTNAPEGPRGYRIPDSDLYQTSGADGTPQPFFAQIMEDGTRANTFCVPDLVSADREKGNFVKMGGVFNTQSRTWTTPRDWSYIFLEKTSTLSDIETGSGVTVIVN